MAITGIEGQAAFAGVTADLKEWSLDIDADVLDGTKFGDTWKRNQGGLKGWSGSASGFYDGSDATTAVGTTVALTLTDGNGGTYTGQAVIAKAAVKVTVDSLVEISFDFTGDGSLTGPA